MEIAKARCPKGEYHRVWLDAGKAWVQDAGGSRCCANQYGPEARDTGPPTAIAQSFLATLRKGW